MITIIAHLLPFAAMNKMVNGRINNDELRRFYKAVDGNFPILVKSIRKSIRWRETYAILTPEQLERWSHLVFWHGYDIMMRPCLVIRLGLACSTLSPSEKPRFTQAIGMNLHEYLIYHWSYPFLVVGFPFFSLINHFRYFLREVPEAPISLSRRAFFFYPYLSFETICYLVV